MENIGEDSPGILSEHKWCKKCGSKTEFINGKRCRGENGKLHIEIPSFFDLGE
jgi:hypothetical protein